MSSVAEAREALASQWPKQRLEATVETPTGVSLGEERKKDFPWRTGGTNLFHEQFWWGKQ